MVSLAGDRSSQFPNFFSATIVKHDEAAQISLLRWHRLLLRVPLASTFAPGTVVGWSIPADQVRLLSNSGRPASIDDTPVLARLIDVVVQDNAVNVTAESVDAPAVRLAMTADEKVAREHGVVQGAELTLRLRGRSIRVVPVDEISRRLQ